jgi:hypothetical protein
MPARDIYHQAVRHALEADGWTITDDPLRLAYGGENAYVDLGAERGAIAAEKDGQKIAVEIKSFLNPSPMHDLEEAVGQYQIYSSILQETLSDRITYLAVPERAYESILAERFGQMLIRRLQLKFIIFDEKLERIVRWIH